jgi:ABC-type phosphate transport system auxiliary subunit
MGRPSLNTGAASRGLAFLPLLLANWQLIAIGLLALTVIAYYRHCESVKSEYATFKAEVKRTGDEQEKRTQETIARNQKEKERADEMYKRNLARLERDIKRLRDSSNRSVVPPAPAEARDPSRATFDRAELDRALGAFIGDVTGITEEGAKAVEGLDSLK